MKTRYRARRIDPLSLVPDTGTAVLDAGRQRVWRVEDAWVLEESGVFRPISVLRARQLGVAA